MLAVASTQWPPHRAQRVALSSSRAPGEGWGGPSHPSKPCLPPASSNFQHCLGSKTHSSLEEHQRRLVGWLQALDPQFGATPLELLLELRTRGVLHQGREALGSQVTCPCHPTSSVTPQTVTVTCICWLQVHRRAAE